MLEPLFKEAQFWEKAVKRWEEARNTIEHTRPQGGDRAAELVETMTRDALHGGGGKPPRG